MFCAKGCEECVDFACDGVFEVEWVEFFGCVVGFDCRVRGVFEVAAEFCRPFNGEGVAGVFFEGHDDVFEEGEEAVVFDGAGFCVRAVDLAGDVVFAVEEVYFAFGV